MTATKDKATAASGGLTPKQKRFVEEYLIDLNATAAFRRAGYVATGNAAEVNASRLLRNAKVATAIAQAQSKRSVRTEITQDMVLKELAKIGFSDIRKVIRWGNTTVRKNINAEGEEVEEPYHGIALIDSSEIDDETAAAIAEVSEGRDGLKVKLHDKKSALVDIGRHLGMFTDRIDHTSSDGSMSPKSFSEMYGESKPESS